VDDADELKGRPGEWQEREIDNLKEMMGKSRGVKS